MNEQKRAQKQKVMHMNVDERKDIEKKVKAGSAYQAWHKRARAQKIKYTIFVVLFFVFIALNVYSKHWGKNAHNAISALGGAYIAIVIVYLIIESIYAKAHPLVWRCPECGSYLPCRHSDFARGAESYIPDTYVSECPNCHHDLTK